MDIIKLWILTIDPGVVVLSETWLKRSITDSDIAVQDNNLYRADRVGKGVVESMSSLKFVVLYLCQSQTQTV